MGGSKPSSVVGYKYLLGMEMGFCHGPADALREIWIDDRLAWSGRSTGGRVVIHKPELFGGEGREGGVSGYLDLRMGLPDQAFNDYLDGTQDFPTGAARGVISAVLRRMYLGMNPYLKKWELVFERILTGHEGASQWRPELAMIPGEPVMRDAAIYIAFDVSGSMDGAPMAALKAALVAFLEALKTRVSPDWPSDIKLVGWGEAIRHRREASIAEAADLDPLIAWIEALPETHAGEGTDYTTALSEADAFFNGAGHPVPHPYQEGFAGWGDSGDVSWAFPAGAKPGKRRIAILLTDAQSYSSSAKATMQAQIAATGSLEVFGVVIGDGSDAMLTGIDNTPGDGIARVAAGDGDALLAVLSSAAGAPDLNGVHMLREQFTNPVWGCGVPESEMGASWEAAAETAKAEGLGLSLRFGEQSRADAIEEIERHLGAVAYDDPLTGLTEIRLIRDDYDPAALPVLDGSNVIEWSALSRRLRSEAVNSVTVTYRDRLSRATEPRTATDIAAQAATGRVIPHRVAYPGVRRGDLAARLAERDLRALGAELLSASVTVTAAAGRGLHKGAPVVLHSPKRNVETVICRVMEVERSGSSLGGVRLDLVEDVFSFGYQPVIAASGGGSGRRATASSAAAASPRVVQEAPYRALVLREGEAETDALLADAPYLGALSVTAACPRRDAFDALVAVDAGGGFEEVGGVTLAPGWTLLAPLSGAADDLLARVATDARARDLAPGAAALLGLEWVTIESVVLAETAALGPHMVLTLGRGCLDTVPVPHPTGTALLPAGGDEDLAGYYLQGESAAVRLRTRTGRGTLALTSAPEDVIAFDARAIRPYPPGRVQLGGAWAAEGIPAAPLALTWAHRDRTIQTTGAIESFATGDIGPEPGVAYRVEEREVLAGEDMLAGTDVFAPRDVFAADAPGRLVRGQDLGTATAWTWDSAFAPDLFAAADLFSAEEFFGTLRPGALYAELRVIAARDGFESWTVPSIRARRLLAPEGLAFEEVEGGVRLAWRPRDPSAEALHVYRSATKFNGASLPAPEAILAPGAASWEAEGLGWFAVGAVKGGATALSEILSPGDQGAASAWAVPVFSAERVDTGSNSAGVITGYDRVFHAGTGDFDAAAGVWTVAATGLYLLAAASFPYSGTPAGTTVRAIIQRNGATLFGSRFYRASGSGAGSHGVTGGVAALTAGDALRLYSQGDGANDARLAAIQLVGLVAMSAVKATASGAVGATIGGYDAAAGSTERFDLASGVFTVPKSGLYYVQAQGYPAGGISGVGLSTRIQVNGADVPDLVSQVYWPGTFGDTVGTPIMLQLIAGDTVSLLQDGKARQDVVLTVVEVPASAPAFSAKVASAGTPQTDWTLIGRQGEGFDPASGVFTVPEDGVYLIAHTATGVANAGSAPGPYEVQARVLIDGGDAIRGRYYAYGTIFRGQPAAEVLIALSAGQEVTFTGINSAAASAFAFAWRVG